MRNDFAVFILTHGRADNVATMGALKKGGYTGKWYMIIDNEDETVDQYHKNFGPEHGQVMYCCHKPYEIIGHVMDSNILEAKAKARTDMSRCDIPCRMTAPNKFMAQMEKERKDPYFI